MIKPSSIQKRKTSRPHRKQHRHDHYGRNVTSSYHFSEAGLEAFSCQQKAKYARQHASAGVAFIAVLFASVALLTAVVGITAALTLNTRRTTANQSVNLQAHYAAETALTAAQARHKELQMLLAGIRLPVTLQESDFEFYALAFCGVSTLNKPPLQVRNWEPQARQEGALLCEAKTVRPQDLSRFDVITDHVDPQLIKALGLPAEEIDRYLARVFSGETEITLDLTQELGMHKQEVRAKASLSLRPHSVRQMLGTGYLFTFAVDTVTAVGEVVSNGRVIARRKLSLSEPTEHSSDLVLKLQRPSFAQYAFFASSLKNPHGIPQAWQDGNVIRGRVHVNGEVLVDSKRVGGGPRFYDGRFTSSAPDRTWLHAVPESYKVSLEEMFQGGYEFDLEPVSPPDNAHHQLRAVFNLAVDEAVSYEHDTRSLMLTFDEICYLLGRPDPCLEGIYYSQADARGIPNQGRDWLGGIYILGNVTDLAFMISDEGGQVISVRHENGQHVIFSQKRSGQWRVTDTMNPRPPLLSEAFNGLIFVDGKIGSDTVTYGGEHGLRGDGSDAPDIAQDSLLTITATGNINIKNSITYQDNPLETSHAVNVLGLYTTGGNIIIDGPYGQSVELHGTVMALSKGKGYGAESHLDRGEDVYIHLLGGMTVDAVLGVGYTYASNTSSPQTRRHSTTGYITKITYDPRMNTGFAPPFYPTQNTWEDWVSGGLATRQLWQFVR